MSTKHLTEANKQALMSMLDSGKAPDLIRLVAQYVAVNHDIAATGDKIRSELCRIALEIQYTL